MSEEAKCTTCGDTGFYGDNSPGIIENNEWHPCECEAEDKVHIALADATDKASRGWEHLQAIWDACEFSYEWEYGGFLARHVVAKITELEARNEHLEAHDKKLKEALGDLVKTWEICEHSGGMVNGVSLGEQVSAIINKTPST